MHTHTPRSGHRTVSSARKSSARHPSRCVPKRRVATLRQHAVRPHTKSSIPHNVHHTSHRHASFNSPHAEEKSNHVKQYDAKFRDMDNFMASFDLPEQAEAAFEHKLSTFPRAQWTIQDTMSILPYWISNINPEAPAMINAKHRVANLRARLYQEEETYRAKRRTQLDLLAAEKEEADALNWRTNNTLNQVPVADIIRLLLQVSISTLNHSIAQYEWANQVTFEKQTNINTIYQMVLDHMEFVPALSYYRIRYNQILPHIVALWGDLDYETQVLPQLTLIDASRLQRIAKKRLAYAKSSEFRTTLKETFKKADLLTDTSHISMHDPSNMLKEQIVRDIASHEHAMISQKAGLSLPIGHLLLEIELALGSSFPSESKHELHIRSVYNMYSIAKMPLEHLKPQYIAAMNKIPIPGHILGNSNRQTNSSRTILDDESTSTSKLLYSPDSIKPKTDVAPHALSGAFNPDDNFDFINEIEFSCVDLPQELWLTPVSRPDRQNWFKQYPEMHTMYNLFEHLVRLTYERRSISFIHKKAELSIERFREAKKELLLPSQGNLDNASKDVIDSLRNLQNQIDAYTKQMNKCQEKISAIDDQLANARNEYQAASRIAKRSYPEYFENIVSPL